MLPEWTLFHLLQNAAERAPDQVAVVDDDKTRHTYGQLQQASARLAHALRAHGLKRGDRVGVYVEKSFEALAAMTACAHAGAVFVNINPLLKAAQVGHIMKNCGARQLIVDGEKLSAELPAVDVAYLRGKAPPSPSIAADCVRLDDVFKHGPALEPRTCATQSELGTIIYTSGSTGLPKGIMLSHHNLVVGAQIVSTYLENTSSDRVLSLLPLTFDVGMNQFTTMLRVGGTLVLQRSMMPGDTLANLRKERITGLAGVPSVWALVLQNKKSLEREPLSELRYVSNTGGMIPSTHLELLKTVLPKTKIFLMYGLTEAFRSTFLPPEEVGRGPACIGKAIPNTDIWVVRPDGTLTADDEEGELIHRGPTVALGYWGDPEKTRAAYRVNPFAPPELNGADMVVYSGDVVRRDAEGFLHYVGRRDEQIKTQGYRVSPLEIEELLYGTGRVHEAAAFGKKDELLGQRIVVICSLSNGAAATPEELRRLLSTRAPSHLVPQEVHIVPDLPKNANGKTDRSLLRGQYA
ncbi:MAG: AMP-binding protein [Archangium sp.]|nr:AMP-binding protein [Archangium sp.]MDP3156605.1 AMP-binding protein [Archangium sp.]MDP3576294.1 AMP-binding protein [Archangium sp.]